MDIKDKYLLTMQEASEYFNIGVKKIRSLVSNPSCNFIIQNGKKVLIKRKAMEDFIDGEFYI